MMAAATHPAAVRAVACGCRQGPVRALRRATASEAIVVTVAAVVTAAFLRVAELRLAVLSALLPPAPPLSRRQ